MGKGTRQLGLFLAGLILTGMVVGAQPKDIVCPWTLAVTETVQGIPKDLRVGHDDVPDNLFTVTMAHAGGSYIQENYEKNLPDGKMEYTWDLNSVVKRQPWFVRCEYARTNILLLIPIPAEMKFCATTQKDGLDQNVENVMHCR